MEVGDGGCTRLEMEGAQGWRRRVQVRDGESKIMYNFYLRVMIRVRDGGCKSLFWVRDGGCKQPPTLLRHSIKVREGACKGEIG